MRITDARGMIRVAAIVAITFIASNRSAQSSGITASIDYSTSGMVESGGVVGTPIISFQGVGDGTLTTGGTPFDLGHFEVTGLPVGSSTTYSNTPFDLTFTPKSVEGVPIAAQGPIVIQGWLNGTVVGNDASGLSAFFNGIPGLPAGGTWVPPSDAPPFAIGNMTNFLDLAPGADAVRFTTSAGGSAPLQAVIYSTEVVPEPSTLAIFACAAGAVFIRRRRHLRLAE